MIPVELLPGFAQWGGHLHELLVRPEALWIFGPSGSGVSTLAENLAQRRGVSSFEAKDPEEAARWLADHPRGIVAARETAPEPVHTLVLHLLALDEDPTALPAILKAMALEEGLQEPLPTALAVLPCPGNLREMRNRLLRWKLMGQLPESESGGPPRLEAEDLATNLHDLERFLLHRALRRAYGNRVEASQRLGVSRRQLYLLIRRHGDPVRGERGTGERPKRLLKQHPAQNSSPEPDIR
jgi:hypothetical protein